LKGYLKGVASLDWRLFVGARFTSNEMVERSEQSVGMEKGAKEEKEERKVNSYRNKK
jgi:hypothetical protein